MDSLGRVISESQPTLGDERLTLRPLVPADASALWQIGQADDIGRYTSIEWPFTPEAAERLITAAAAAWIAGTAVRFAICPAPAQQLSGVVSLLHIYPERADAEVAYWLGEGMRGQGLARQAVALLCDWALTTLPLQRLHLMVDLDNLASQRVALTCGFREVGTVWWAHPTERSKDAECLVYERWRDEG